MATITDYRKYTVFLSVFATKKRVVKHSSNGLETSYINNPLLT